MHADRTCIFHAASYSARAQSGRRHVPVSTDSCGYSVYIHSDLLIRDGCNESVWSQWCARESARARAVRSAMPNTEHMQVCVCTCEPALNRSTCRCACARRAPRQGALNRSTVNTEHMQVCVCTCEPALNRSTVNEPSVAGGTWSMVQKQAHTRTAYDAIIHLK